MSSINTVWLGRARAGLHMMFHPGTRLSQRVVHAGSWAFALRITLRVFTTARTIVLARLLAPADFGLMGIALLMMSMMETFTQTGFRAALIQRQGDIRPYLDTAWTIHIIRGLLLAGGMFLAAPLVAGFFDAPEAAMIVRVMAIAVIIGGFNNIGIIYFQKELEFQKRFLYEVASVVPQVVVGIGLAFALQSVWALVYGSLAGSAAHLVASYVLHPYRPRPRLEWGKAGELFNFGKWVFGSRILMYGLLHLDSLVVGRVLGPAALGLYQMAHNLSQIVSTEVTSILNQVAFPAYSKLQDRREKLQEAYTKSIGFIAFFSFPLAGGLFLVAPYFIPVVLGEKWLPMVPAFQLLVIWALLRSISAANGPVVAAIGRPDVSTKVQLVKLLILGALVYPFTAAWGLVGTAMSLLVAALIVDGAAVYVANRMIRNPISALGKPLGYPLVNTLFMMGAIVLFGMGPGLQHDALQMVAVIALGVISYMGAVAICAKWLGYTTGGLLAKKIRGRRTV